MVPLGASGFALQGIGGTFAHQFTARLDPKSDKVPVDIPNVQANNYVRWASAERGQPMDAWLPVPRGKREAGGFGLRTDIIDMPSCG
jgi:hypothetical protein